MANILIMAPAPIASVTATRGHDAVLLLTRDPKEVWTDGPAGGSTELRIDLGAARTIDTVFLGALYRAAGAATWSITAGVAADDEMTVAASAALRAPEAAGRVSAVSHALWHGEAFSARYITITVSQPAGSLPLQAGSVMVGAAFVPTWNKEWGSGRGVIDTGTATRLPSGGLATVEGARLGSYAWTLGDLTDAETDAMYGIQLDVGETLPVLVVEDPAATTGLRQRIHYGRLVSLRKYERREAALTRWEMAMEDWI